VPEVHENNGFNRPNVERLHHIVLDMEMVAQIVVFCSRFFVAKFLGFVHQAHDYTTRKGTWQEDILLYNHPGFDPATMAIATHLLKL